MKNNAI